MRIRDLPRGARKGLFTGHEQWKAIALSAPIASFRGSILALPRPNTHSFGMVLNRPIHV
jgi:hypothetical protein